METQRTLQLHEVMSGQEGWVSSVDPDGVACWDYAPLASYDCPHGNPMIEQRDNVHVCFYIDDGTPGALRIADVAVSDLEAFLPVFVEMATKAPR